MIIVKLKGGLGNQMFQYAFGRRMAEQNNDTLKLDVSHYETAHDELYGLSAFNIKEAFATPDEIRRLQFPLGPIQKISRIIIGKIFRIFSGEPEMHVTFKPRYLNKKGDMYLDGYWQSEKFFDSISSTIRKEFTLKNPLSPQASEIAEMIKRDYFAVSLQIRRGDHNNNEKNLDEEKEKYYKDAIRFISDRVPRSRVYVFSDDIEWVKNNFRPGIAMEYVSNSGIKDFEEMYLMSLCRHNIISNSSFAWWGAWLNNRPDKIVITPKKWFNTRKSGYKNIVSESWTRI